MKKKNVNSNFFGILYFFVMSYYSLNPLHHSRKKKSKNHLPIPKHSTFLIKNGSSLGYLTPGLSFKSSRPKLYSNFETKTSQISFINLISNFRVNKEMEFLHKPFNVQK